VIAIPPSRQRLVAADLARQMGHWLAAAKTFADAEEFAPAAAWRSLEDTVGLPIRRHLGATVQDLIALGKTTSDLVAQARRDGNTTVRAVVATQQFRRRYAQVEVTLDFFGDAVTSRTSGPLQAALTALDQLAVSSMMPALVPAKAPVPPVLTYLDKGMGASILRAGIRLWAPGTVNPCAAIKIVRHNLYRPTSLFHETGHQVAHETGWTQSMRDAIARVLSDDAELRTMWVAWSSEIAADVYAFLHTGYASVAALYDVVGDARTILRWPIGDPHPIGWSRTLLGCALARVSFGTDGPWEALEQSMLASHPADAADPTVARLLIRSRARIGAIAKACLAAPVPRLGGAPMTSVLDPRRVSPSALAELERSAGRALWTSPAWRKSDGIRIVALAGLREAERPETASEWIDRARTWMTREARAA
jgi:hypothetical protein